jgi:hypothetical protein
MASHNSSRRTADACRGTCRPVPTALIRLSIGALLGVSLARGAEPSAEQIELFETGIRPLLVEHCYDCHGDLDEPESGLRLTSRAAILAGGDSGPAAVAGSLDSSLLIEAVRYRGLEMPPQGKLPPEDIQKFERWVELGLPWPEDGMPASAPPTSKSEFEISPEQRSFWSFQPVKAPPVPAVADAGWPRGNVDRFILAKLEAAGLAPSPPADKRGAPLPSRDGVGPPRLRRAYYFADPPAELGGFYSFTSLAAPLAAGWPGRRRDRGRRRRSARRGVYPASSRTPKPGSPRSRPSGS